MLPDLTPKEKFFQPYQGAMMILVLVLVAYLQYKYLLVQAYSLTFDELGLWSLLSENPGTGFLQMPVLATVANFSLDVFGKSEAGLRALVPFVLWGTSLGLYYLIQPLYGAKRAFWSAALFALLPANTLLATHLSAGVFMMFFWVMAMTDFYKAVTTNQPIHWRFVAVLVAMGLLFDATMLIFVICAGLYLWLDGTKDQKDKAWKTLMLSFFILLCVSIIRWWVGGVVALPEIFNHSLYHFSGPFHYQTSQHFMQNQLITLTPLIFPAVLITLLFFYPLLREKRSRFLLCFTAPPLLMALVQSMTGDTPHFTPLYALGVLPIIINWVLDHKLKLLLLVGVLGCLMTSVALYNYQSFLAAVGVESRQAYDPFYDRRGWQEVGQSVAANWAIYADAQLAAENKLIASALSFYANPTPQHIYLFEELLGDKKDDTNYLFVTDNPTPLEGMKKFEFARQLSDINIRLYEAGDVTRQDYHTYFLSGYSPKD